MTPFLSLALAVGLITICWAIVLLQRERVRRARFLIGMVGLVAVFHGLRMLTESGLIRFREMEPYGGIVDVIVATLCLIALMILHNEVTRQHVTAVRLRLSEAMELPRASTGVTAAVRLPREAQVGQGKESAEVEPHLRHLIQNSLVAIVAFDTAGGVSSSNAAADRLFGQEDGLKLGKPLPALPVRNEVDDSSLRNLSQQTLNSNQKQPASPRRDSHVCPT